MILGYVKCRQRWKALKLFQQMQQGSSLIDMYVKCASMEDAWKVLHKMPSPIGVLWTTILGGSAMHGHDKKVLKHFEQMCEKVYS
jgi:pentatricopeptide repeat protein